MRMPITIPAPDGRPSDAVGLSLNMTKLLMVLEHLPRPIPSSRYGGGGGVPLATSRRWRRGTTSGRGTPHGHPTDTPPRYPRERATGHSATGYTPGMTLPDYKVILYRQIDGAWVAEVPAIGGCYALMETPEAALEELDRVFQLIAEEHAERGQALPTDTTQIVHA